MTEQMTETDLGKMYQQKTDKQHILDNPDTYIGSVENVDCNMWVFDETTQKIMLKQIEYIPGLYKLFDEGIVNCRDHVIRMIQSTNENKKNVTYIETSISEDGTITFINDGDGIDIAKHPENNLWIPEMVFGHLRTSTNYNKDEKKIVGGKNGFGFKLVLIWSVYGYVETVDHKRGKMYTQEFKNNLNEICEPVITNVKPTTKPYTKVVFKPDYERLHILGLTPDMISLLKKRIYDIGAVTDHHVKKIKVLYNKTLVPVKNFQEYIDLYIGNKECTKRVYETSNERWEYAVALSPTHQFEQISFVNGICTFKGGKHVDYIMGQITRNISAYIEKKKKITVNANTIKEQLMLFLRCDIVNPSFDSQTKDFMNTPSNKFGSTCSVSDAFIEKVAKMGVMEVACSLMEIKDIRLAKKTDGVKTKNIRGITNFIDANHAGTQNSKDCILILCEGLSALSGIVSGLSTTDRNIIGIYPLKGKLMNVRDKEINLISKNKEICDIKKILGLETGKEYKTLEDVHNCLRYSKIMILCDQDLDGSHIKALFLNLVNSEWQSLFKISGFLSYMNTPILRVKKGNSTSVFYNEGEYQDWKKTMNEQEIQKWNVKYFKGLGTSTSVEFKEYFANKKIVDFVYNGNESDNVIDKVFNKKRIPERKVWLNNYNKNIYLNTSLSNVKYEDFMNYELIHFSIHDCQRSMPNLMDGLKNCQRKILYSAFKRNLVNEIKVAQFSGYISEHTNYHHGEASLHTTTISMAQNFVGSNNINLFEPKGQFGSRLTGPEGAASERYIFTHLTPITRFIFSEKDDCVLDYLNDDGTMVEPLFYAPIIPFVLINGISGIGTAYSCNIPSYNPSQIICYLKKRLVSSEKISEDFVPFYEGFTGEIVKIEDKKFSIKGTYKKIDEDKIKITELPVGSKPTWIMPYIAFLEILMDWSTDDEGHKIPPIIKDFVSNSTENIIDIVVVFPKGKLQELENTNSVEKILKLKTTISTTNLHLFNKDLVLTKYNEIEDIIEDFYQTRLEIFAKRKEYLINEIQKKLIKISNRARYIQLNLDGTIDLRRKKMVEVNELLMGLNFQKIDDNYHYLTKMTMDSVFQENVNNMLKEKANAEMELQVLENTSIQEMWMNELNELNEQYENYKISRNNSHKEKGIVIKKKKSLKITK